MTRKPSGKLTARVRAAAIRALEKHGQLAYEELFIEMDILLRRDLEAWHQRKVPFLEKVIQANLTRLARIQTAVRRFAKDQKLQPVGRPLKKNKRYSKSNKPFVENEYRTVYRPRKAPATQPPARPHPGAAEVDTARGATPP